MRKLIFELIQTGSARGATCSKNSFHNYTSTAVVLFSLFLFSLHFLFYYNTDNNNQALCQFDKWHWTTATRRYTSSKYSSFSSYLGCRNHTSRSSSATFRTLSGIEKTQTCKEKNCKIVKQSSGCDLLFCFPFLLCSCHSQEMEREREIFCPLR